jgi:hypothetical protein
MHQRLSFALTAAALCLPLTAVAAQAPVVRPMGVVANTPAVCVLKEPKLAGGSQINFRGLNGNTLQIDRLVDPATLAINAASADIEFEAVCNYPHRIKVETQNNGLWQTSERSATPPPGFAFAVPYSATLDWGLEHGRLEADAKVRRISEHWFNVDRATSGELHIRIEVQAGASNVQENAPLLAGYYGDTLRVTLEPQP